MSAIVYNAIRCPDGTVLESRSRWDCKIHTQADGRVYGVDGGDAYHRIISCDGKHESLLVNSEAPHEVIREVFGWTSSYDKYGNRLKAYVTLKLKDLEDSHINALVDYTAENGYPEYIQKIMKDEQEYRNRVRTG